MYKMSNAERETHISWDAEEKVAHIWTCDPATIRKLDKLCQECAEYKVVRREQYVNTESVFYTAPAKLISFRKPKAMPLTEEQRIAVRERLLASRNIKSCQDA